MPDPNTPKLSDEELDRLARELFAEVRGEYPEAKVDRALKTAGELAGEVIPILPDWLVNTGEDAGDSGSGDGVADGAYYQGERSGERLRMS